MTAKPEHETEQTPLSARELLFADEYIRLGACKGRGKQAAVKAGLSPKTADAAGRRMLKNVRVAAYIREREGVILQHIENKQLVTRELIIDRLNLIYAQCMIGEPEMVWQDGELVHSGLWQFDSKGALRATELLGKTINLFTEKVDPNKEPFNLNIILTEPERRAPKTIEHEPQESSPGAYDTPTINLERPA